MAAPQEDPVIQLHRAQIAAVDREILGALNRRLGLVARLRAHKAARGLAFHDAAQEARVLADLREANAGPLSEEGLEALVGFLLAWTRREVTREDAPPEG
jgi:chorismate mutase